MNSDRLSNWAPWALAGLRILAGIMFALHGAQKILGWFGGIPPEAKGWMTTTAGWMEMVGGVLLAVGLLTRPAAFFCSGLMAVAYFYGHARNGSVLPTVNGGELAVLYCWLFLYLWLRGPGALALDSMLSRRSREGDRP